MEAPGGLLELPLENIDKPRQLADKTGLKHLAGILQRQRPSAVSIPSLHSKSVSECGSESAGTHLRD